MVYGSRGGTGQISEGERLLSIYFLSKYLFKSNEL